MKTINTPAGTNPDEQLRMDIETWIARHGLSATRFGRDALGDPRFVETLARGRRVRLDTADRVLAFMGEAPLGPAFRDEVESYLAMSGTKPHVLGEEALGDPSFVSRLRRGASPRLATVECVRVWMAAQGEAQDMTGPAAGIAPGSFTTKAPHERCGVRNERKGETYMNGNGRHYLSTREAADWLGLSPRTLDRYRVSGEGPVFHRFGGRVRYLLIDLEDWAQARRRTSTSDDGSATGRRSR